MLYPLSLYNVTDQELLDATIPPNTGFVARIHGATIQSRYIGESPRPDRSWQYWCPLDQAMQRVYDRRKAAFDATFYRNKEC